MTDLGRRLLHDPRSREHAYTETAGTLTHVRHTMNAQHVDQFYLGACVGFSGTNWLNTSKAVNNRRKFSQVRNSRSSIHYRDNNDGIENYHEATVYDGLPGQYPPTDEGSTALGLMKWWKKVGVISQYNWTFTFDAFLAGLTAQPVLVGTNWYDDMMSTGADGIVHSSASGNGGGHEYCATEIIPAGTQAYRRLWKTTHIGYENSWGQHPPDFGINGRFWMPADLAEELIIHQQGDVAVPGLL